MKNKWVPYVFVIIAVVIAFSLDLFQSDGDGKNNGGSTTFAKVPEVQLLISGEPVEYKSGIFDWIEQGTGIIIDQNEPPIMFHDIQSLTVKPFSILDISFSEEPDHAEIAVFQANYDLEQGISEFNSLIKNQYTFNNYPGTRTVIIRASYGNQEFHYTFPVIIEQTISYQHQLAEEKGKLAVLEIHDDSQKQDNWSLEKVTNTYIHKAQSRTARSVEEAQAMFPELQITSLPYYAVFNHEKVLYQMNDSEEFVKLLRVVIP
ncbi:hypothetical protein AABM38_12185 [Heyndrickxia sp. MSNUG]|uniref:hypothetical protein n=1 Tax=Heyndrickxia sp. MSNUG TaxID=3136677 RepID=UPI003C30AF72